MRGPKGVFNAQALRSETVYVCEAAFDAISLITAGYKDACAIYGLSGLRWEWVKARRMWLCLDNDDAGQGEMQELAQQATSLGIEVIYLEPRDYQGFKDLNELWVRTSRIDLGQWVPLTQDFQTVTVEPALDPDKAELAALAKEWDDDIAYRLCARHDLPQEQVYIVNKDTALLHRYLVALEDLDKAVNLKHFNMFLRALNKLDLVRAAAR